MNFTRFLLSALLVTLAACSNGPYVAEGIPADDEVRNYREIFADDLFGDVQVGDPVTRRNEQGLLIVTVPLRNVAGEDLELLWQVRFIDEFGAPSGDETNKRSLILNRGSEEPIRATSRTSNARDYRLYLWRANP